MEIITTDNNDQYKHFFNRNNNDTELVMVILLIDYQSRFLKRPSLTKASKKKILKYPTGKVKSFFISLNLKKSNGHCPLRKESHQLIAESYLYKGD